MLQFLLTASKFIRTILTISLLVAMEAFRDALTSSEAHELLVGASSTRQSWFAVRFIRTVKAIFLSIAYPCLQNALLIGTTEFIRFAVYLAYGEKYWVKLEPRDHIISTYRIEFHQNRQNNQIYRHILDV